MKTNYGIRSLNKQFPNEAACLSYIFDTLHTKECSCGGMYAPLFHTDPTGELVGRRQYQCSKCRFQIAPTVGTIFEKSVTPLMLWFHAILVFSNAKSGISAKQLQRELEVTYKCAYRILTQIRKALGQDKTKLRGDVEIDTGYFGGKGYGGKYNENASDVMFKKSVVIVGAERGGRIKAEVVISGGTRPLKDFIDRNIEKKATSLMTDATNMYKNITKGYDVHSVNHSKKEYVRDDIHVNTVETFFAHLKRSIAGTFKSVSKKKLQTYLDAFVFHYNNRHSDKARFEALFGSVLRPAV